MNVTTLYKYGTPGNYLVMDARVAHVEIIQVTRSGQAHSVVEYDANYQGGTEFKYNPSMGAIEFNTTFSGPEFGRPNRNDLEKITITYKTP